MRKTVLVFAACACVLAVPAQALAWGFAAHQLIMRRAIELLPPELKPFYERYRDEIVIRSTDPDLWRNVGWDDDPNHFVDFGVPEYGKPPFLELPREHGAALQKFGSATLKRNGTLPWRVEEMFGNLRRGFENMGRRSPYGISDVTLFSGVASHYLQDAHQPLHATDNHDGQRTGNQGIHSRFETELILKYGSRLHLSPAPPQPLANPRDTAFDALVTSYQQVDRIMAADKASASGKDMYDDEYFEKLFKALQPVLEERLSAAATATASMIVSAWEQAGRPVPYTVVTRTPQRVRR
jgi:hypothetical protein